MLLKTVVLLMMLAIVASLGSAAVFLLRRRHGKHENMARALTWRIGLSIALFLLLMTGFYFDILSPHGVAPR
jgi:ABC-type Mn2+/Zn2+ transport system permease subunit